MIHQTLFAQVRTLRIASASRLGIGQEVGQVDHPIFPSDEVHSVLLLSHFNIHGDGSSSFHKRYGKGPRPKLAELGYNVFFKAYGKHFAVKT